MKVSLTLGSLLAATLLVGSASAAEEVKSGPQAGDKVPGAFNPLHANGPDEGKKLCLV